MKTCSRNQSQIVLQKSLSDLDGTPKTNISTATVKVYSIVEGVETNILASTNLSQGDSANIYRYIWEPTTLNIGEYFIEYYFQDTNGVETRVSEDLIVLDVPSREEFETIIQIETGRWRIINYQMIFYEEDGTTELMRFNLFDENGNPTNTDVMERIPV